MKIMRHNNLTLAATVSSGLSWLYSLLALLFPIRKRQNWEHCLNIYQNGVEYTISSQYNTYIYDLTRQDSSPVSPPHVPLLRIKLVDGRKLRIDPTQAGDAGIWQATATNKAGSAQHAIYLKVYLIIDY